MKLSRIVELDLNITRNAKETTATKIGIYFLVSFCRVIKTHLKLIILMDYTINLAFILDTT